jgi:formate/nitrite transporter FocA (FNT family)
VADRRDAGEQPGEVLRQRPQQIERRAEHVGQERLGRGALDMLVTALIGGAEVSLGALAAMAVVGALHASFPGLDETILLAAGGLVFPIGFLFVIAGRSELYTENFLIPVVAAVTGDCSALAVVRLWLLSWAGNLAGCALVGLLVIVPGSLPDPVRQGYVLYTEHKLAVPALGVGASALLAGMMMTVLTWVLLAVRSGFERIAAIWAVGFLVFATNVAHTVVGAAVLFPGVVLSGGSAGSVGLWLAIATVANLAGGVGLVTLLRIVQSGQAREAG